MIRKKGNQLSEIMLKQKDTARVWSNPVESDSKTGCGYHSPTAGSLEDDVPGAILNSILLALNWHPLRHPCQITQSPLTTAWRPHSDSTPQGVSPAAGAPA